MEKPKDMIYVVAAIGSIVAAVCMAVFYVLALFFPVLFNMGTPAERMAYLLSNPGLRSIAWYLALTWSIGEIPVGIGLFNLIKERDRSVAFLGIPFWLMGVAAQFLAYTLRFNLLRGVTGGLLSPQTFAFLDGLGFAWESTGVMLLSVAVLVFGFVLIREQGLLRIAGSLFVLEGATVITGYFLILTSTIAVASECLFDMGMLFYGLIGAGLLIICFGLMAPIFLRSGKI